MAANADSMKNNEKIGRILQKFLEPNFKIRNDAYLNLFLTHIVNKNDSDKPSEHETNKQLKEQFCQWIIQASDLWDQQKMNPQAIILSFGLNLASQQSADEQIFVRLNCQNVYESLVGVAQTNLAKDPRVTHGLVTLLCSFLEHKSGLQWVVATTHWIYVVSLGLKAHTMYIRKKAYQFVIKLLEKTISFNRKFGVSLVGILVMPLKDTLRSLPSGKNTPHTQIENRELYESLKPTLDFILEIVESLLKNSQKKVLHLFLEQEISKTVNTLLLLSRNEDFSFQLLQIEYVFLFLNLCEKVDGVKAVAHDSLALFDTKVMFDLMQNEMDKNYVRCVIKICEYAHGLFSCLASRMPKVIRKGNIIEFPIQAMFLQVTPLCGFSYQLMSDEEFSSILLNDALRNDYYHKYMKISNVQCIKMCYTWADSLKTKPDLIDDCIFCLQYFAKLKKLLNKERAATVFPLFMYSFTDALNSLKHTPVEELTPSYLLFLKTIMDTMVDLVESFDLIWKDTIETLSVLDLAYDFLQYPHWITLDKMLIIKGLKLLNTAISKYMSPDMVLLIYNQEDCKISQTGSLLFAKCHDSSWEIRDSALEVVYTLSLNANTKFPAYTNILLNAELPQLVVSMALKDGEYYVRATAFKCLQELIQIPEIWSIFSNMDKFLDNILDVFENETEGIVRKEAAHLIYKIGKFKNFPEEMLPRVYDVMTHAAIGDLHWEVKYNALDFWFNLLEEHLSHQGMIDSVFPSHTFSKEHKKIVALNEAEVRKRIIKVLNQLSQIGCLHVMKWAVQDDCDIEVSKKATSFTFCMLRMFKTYKVSCENVDLNQPTSPRIQLNSHSKVKAATPTSICIEANSNQTSMENLGSPQFSNSPFFDPLSPFSMPYSPALDHSLITPPESVTPQNQSLYGNTVYQQSLLTSRTESNTSEANSTSSQITSNINSSYGMDTSGYESVNFDPVQLEDVVTCSSFDSVQREKLLDEFLNSNDVTLLQGIYNPTDQVTNNTTKMKTKTYLAPSQFLKFVYDEVETHSTEKAQWINSLDEFDSLLDDILKEYNIVTEVNSMDCY